MTRPFRLFTGLLSPVMIGDAGGEIVRKRDNDTAVDIARRVFVVFFDIDDGDIKAVIGMSLHSDVLIEGHGFGPGLVLDEEKSGTVYLFKVGPSYFLRICQSPEIGKLSPPVVICLLCG